MEKQSIQAYFDNLADDSYDSPEMQLFANYVLDSIPQDDEHYTKEISIEECEKIEDSIYNAFYPHLVNAFNAVENALTAYIPKGEN